jgi:competence CoiA-like predicted nuclease
MQFYALDENEFILASSAKRHKDYRCPECLNILRLRGGPHRHLHFYHLQASPSCKQHQKSLTHLQAQLAVQALLPEGEGVLEKPFLQIGRIADVAWEKQGIVFEIQCSPISAAEALERSEDYRSLGLTAVWLLHTRRFNKRLLSAAEAKLRQSSCYFTTINEKGQGIFYDQYEVIRGARRIHRGPPLKISLATPLFDAHGSLYFPGDLKDREYESPPQPPPTKRSFLKTLKRGYKMIFYSLLESLSK